MRPSCWSGVPTRTRRTISRPSTGQEVLAVRELEFSAGLSVRANFRGCTALHYAALTESLEVMEVLLRAGADLLWTNDYATRLGTTPAAGRRGSCSLPTPSGWRRGGSGRRGAGSLWSSGGGR